MKYFFTRPVVWVNEQMFSSVDRIISIPIFSSSQIFHFSTYECPKDYLRHGSGPGNSSVLVLETKGVKEQVIRCLTVGLGRNALGCLIQMYINIFCIIRSRFRVERKYEGICTLRSICRTRPPSSLCLSLSFRFVSLQ